MQDFVAASRVEPQALGRFSWQVPDGWQQGRGAFGGLVLGALARAAGALEADEERRLRVLSGELCAPALPGATDVEARVVRRGAGTTFVEARALQGESAVARATAIFGTARPPSALRVEGSPPELPPPDALPILRMGQPPTPRFASHFVFRSTGPVLGATAAIASGYIQHRGATAAALLDAAAVIALLDAWWPCALVVEPRPRAMATVSFLAELLVDPSTLVPDEPFGYRAEAAGGADGYSIELRQLWQRGALVALNQQVFVAL